MADMISTTEAAALWNLSPRRVAILCKEGRIPGAVLEGRRWLIPADAQKPSDHRLKTAESVKTPKSKLLPLPVGISDFKRASTQYYYVDKTLLIRDFLDELPVVSLFPRPRRFGKTLNMDMLRTFFEKTDEDTSIYFRNKKIWKCGQRYRNYQGKYPVIYITFKDTKLSNWADTLAGIRFLFTNEFQRHGELADSPKCTGSDKEYYWKIVNGTAGEAELMNALLVLSIVGDSDILDVDAGDRQVHDNFGQDAGAVFNIDMQDIRSVDRTACDVCKTLAVLPRAVKKLIDGTVVP